MKIVKKIKLTFVLIISIIILTACNFESIEEQIFNHLEAVVQLEAEFKSQQEPLIKLEQKEKELYDEILALGLKEHDQIVELSNQSIEITEERKALLNAERDSILAAEEEFLKVKDLLEEIKDEELLAEARNLYDIMLKRYDAHEKLFETYLEGINYDHELYEMFKRTDITLDELEQQIENINNTYEKVYELNEQFNSYTKEYNEAKLKFYQNAGLNIELQE